MPKTIDLLEKACTLDVIPPLPVLADYFGLENMKNEDNLCTILGLYQGLIKYNNMDKQIIEKAFQDNKLDNLIHDSYTEYSRNGRNSGYYKIFCEKNIKIGETY